MNRAESFLKKSFIGIFFLFLLLILIYFFSFISQTVFLSIFIAAALSTLNFVIGLFFIKIGLRAAGQKFFQSVLLGILVRFFLILTLVFISLKFLNINANSFIFSILFFYILYLISEVIYLYMKKL
jgi:hypothetical protein